MAQKGGLSHIHYKETKGLKVNAGSFVTKGTILTRQGNKWKAGLNVSGRNIIHAGEDGTIYFTKKSGSYKKNKLYTFININPAKAKKAASQAKKSK
ncbi:MAG: hypothetical protein COV72_04550 [Candidatus Omnitrophica bacterium CG11_big_fil_rev_8_21_14_0_20_42_13]|uniref:50S ribosomal protein L27 n=1 Tax=Candidatus Ghiorseimicrobium undicola TaxID=1974746 RepID=A0A2H0LXP6_9BACT|nr:MAG: hypothetical protein COV72_04550 [Candidatus Omnitrophica bacterium CG11_big_fil_rev_8_21_14_0_20_42_13]